VVDLLVKGGDLAVAAELDVKRVEVRRVHAVGRRRARQVGRLAEVVLHVGLKERDDAGAVEGGGGEAVVAVQQGVEGGAIARAGVGLVDEVHADEGGAGSGLGDVDDVAQGLGHAGELLVAEQAVEAALHLWAVVVLKPRLDVDV